MSVYVTPMKPSPLGGCRRDSHLIADTEEELLAFAKKIDLWPEWMKREENGTPYFLIGEAKRIQAVRAGARDLAIEAQTQEPEQ
jgi:hypothetical protein